MIHHEAGLCLSDFHVVEGNVQIEIAIRDQPVVRDDRGVRLVRQVHGRRHGARVVRDDHQDIDAAAQKRLNVRYLTGVITVRGLHEHLRAAVFRGLDEQVAVPLPAGLFERIHGEPDHDPLVSSLDGSGSAAARQDDADQNAQDQRKNGESDPVSHVTSFPRARIGPA